MLSNGRMGAGATDHPLDNHKCNRVSIELLVRTCTTLEKQLVPIASRWRFVRPSVKYVDD